MKNIYETIPFNEEHQDAVLFQKINDLAKKVGCKTTIEVDEDDKFLLTFSKDDTNISNTQLKSNKTKTVLEYFAELGVILTEGVDEIGNPTGYYKFQLPQ